jgi:NTP pyrophosphatase (non-canonical NTP hydrolase)
VTWQEEIRVIHREMDQKVIAQGPEAVRRWLVLSLAGEAGEVANEVKKEWRGSFHANDPGRLHAIALELADVRLLLELTAKAYDIDLDAACDEKIKILHQRLADREITGRA